MGVEASAVLLMEGEFRGPCVKLAFCAGAGDGASALFCTGPSAGPFPVSELFQKRISSLTRAYLFVVDSPQSAALKLAKLTILEKDNCIGQRSLNPQTQWPDAGPTRAYLG